MTENFTTFQSKDFALRLANLREAQKKSASAMSHELGRNRNYINGIELQRYLPSLSEFFEICSYLEVSASDFFNLDWQPEGEMDEGKDVSLAHLCDELTPEQSDAVYQMIREFLS
jgi:transcriptional regulator with XRE-family HTH domain